MRNLLKIVILIVGIIAILALAYPLIVFTLEASTTPTLVNATYTYTQINQTHINLTLTITYSGSITLNDFTVILGNTTVYFGDLTPHTVKKKDILLNVNELLNSPTQGYEFVVQGLYPIKYLVVRK